MSMLIITQKLELFDDEGLSFLYEDLLEQAQAAKLISDDEANMMHTRLSFPSTGTYPAVEQWQGACLYLASLIGIDHSLALINRALSARE